MTIELQILPLLSIAAGIAILVAPKILNYIVALYLILAGILMLLQ